MEKVNPFFSNKRQKSAVLGKNVAPNSKTRFDITARVTTIPRQIVAKHSGFVVQFVACTNRKRKSPDNICGALHIVKAFVKLFSVARHLRSAKRFVDTAQATIFAALHARQNATVVPSENV